MSHNPPPKWDCVPAEWSISRLNELTSLITDGAHFSPKPKEEGFIIANVKDMKANYIDYEKCTKISKEDFLYLAANKCSPKENDVLLSKDGTIGKVLVFKGEREIVLLSSIAIIRTNEIIFPGFLQCILRSFYFDEQLYALQSGSALKRLILKDIGQLLIPYPNTVIQEKISKIIDTIDTAIYKTEELIAKYEQIKQGMMHDLFTQGIGENNQLRPSYYDAPELYQETVIGFIPKDWEISSLGKISAIRRGASPRPIDDPSYFSDNGRGWIRISDVTRSYKYLTKTTQYLSELGASLSVPVNPGDLIMSICATIGKPVILNMKACIHDGFVFFDDIDENKIDKEYLIYFLINNEQEISRNKQIGTQGNLNTDIVKSIAFPEPKIEEQKAIAKRLSALDETINLERNLLSKLIEQKSGLMQDLLTGKVAVNVERREAA
jgi:type I restriction enzyme S subunit